VSAAVLTMPKREARERLRELRDEFAARARGRRLQGEAATQWARNAEWASLSLDTRCALMVLAGIDGDVPELAARAWFAMPEPERWAIAATMRRLRDELERSRGLMARF
jgi:hypothetical protein